MLISQTFLYLQENKQLQFPKVRPFFIKDAKNHRNRSNLSCRKSDFKTNQRAYKQVRATLIYFYIFCTDFRGEKRDYRDNAWTTKACSNNRFLPLPFFQREALIIRSNIFAQKSFLSGIWVTFSTSFIVNSRLLFNSVTVFNRSSTRAGRNHGIEECLEHRFLDKEHLFKHSQGHVLFVTFGFLQV